MSRVPRRAFCMLMLAFCSLSAGCGGNQSALDPAGPGAARIGELWWLMLLVCAAVWAAVMAALLWAIARRRPPPVDGTSGMACRWASSRRSSPPSRAADLRLPANVLRAGRDGLFVLRALGPSHVYDRAAASRRQLLLRREHADRDPERHPDLLLDRDALGRPAAVQDAVAVRAWLRLSSCWAASPA